MLHVFLIKLICAVLFFTTAELGSSQCKMYNFFFLTDQYLCCKSSLELGKMLRFEYFRCLVRSK